MQGVPITGLADLDIGDIILGGGLEWKITHIGNNRFSTLHRDEGHGDFRCHISNWRVEEFMYPSYVLFKPYKETLYDPAQADSIGVLMYT